MFLQGNLQTMFDALYAIGAIDPVLKLDWNKVTEEMSRNQSVCEKAFATVNAYQNNKNLLVENLLKMDSNVVNYIALEVARELCEYQDRQTLH